MFHALLAFNFTYEDYRCHAIAALVVLGKQDDWITRERLDACITAMQLLEL